MEVNNQLNESPRERVRLLKVLYKKTSIFVNIYKSESEQDILLHKTSYDYK